MRGNGLVGGASDDAIGTRNGRTIPGWAVHKKFSIRKYGERRAFRLAARTRQQGLHNLQSAPFRSPKHVGGR